MISVGPAGVDGDAAIEALLLDAPMEQRPWKAFLRALLDRIDAKTIYISFRPVQHGSIGVGIEVASGDATAIRRAYVDHFETVNPMDFDSMEPGRVYSIRDISAPDHPFCSDFLDPFDLADAYGLRIETREGYIAIIHIITTRDRGELSSAERAFLESLTPMLTHAVRVFAKLRLARFVSAAQTRALEQLAVGMVILDAAGQVLFLTEAASDIAQRALGLRLSQDQKLEFSKPEHRAILTRLLAGDCDPQVFCLGSQAEMDTIEVLLKPLPMEHDFGLENAPALVVYLKDRAAGDFPSSDILARIFNLTVKEGKFLAHLAEGGTIAQVAATLNMSENTARTYCKRILSKVGVGRQADLVRIALRSLAML